MRRTFSMRAKRRGGGRLLEAPRQRLKALHALQSHIISGPAALAAEFPRL